MTEARRDDRTPVFCGGGSVSDAVMIVPARPPPLSARKLTVRQRRLIRHGIVCFDPVLFNESVEPVLVELHTDRSESVRAILDSLNRELPLSDVCD